jgi:hypothetical protein
MSLVIPLRTDLPAYTMSVELDGQTYVLQFLWNFEALGWFVSLFDAAGVAIFEGQRFVVDQPLGKRIRDARMPPGVLMAYDTTGKRQDPGLEDLGTRTTLLYLTAAEI